MREDPRAQRVAVIHQCELVQLEDDTMCRVITTLKICVKPRRGVTNNQCSVFRCICLNVEMQLHQSVTLIISILIQINQNHFFLVS